MAKKNVGLKPSKKSLKDKQAEKRLKKQAEKVKKRKSRI